MQCYRVKRFIIESGQSSFWKREGSSVGKTHTYAWVTTQNLSLATLFHYFPKDRSYTFNILGFYTDMEVNSRRTPTLMFNTPLQLAAKPESRLILMIIVVHIG